MNNYRKRLISIVAPIIISNLISQVQVLIDKIFLGKLSVSNITAIGNASSALWTTMAVVFSVSVGASILISQAVGEENIDKAKGICASLFVYHNIIPMLLCILWRFFSAGIFSALGVPANAMDSCIEYTSIYSIVFLISGVLVSSSVCLQTSGNTKPMAVSGGIRVVLNVFLDYLFVGGNLGCPSLGIRGAAWATVIAELVGAFYLVGNVIKDNQLKTKPCWKELKSADFTKYGKSAKLGLNVAAEEFIWNFTNLVMIRVINSISDNAVGIYTIVFSVEVLAIAVISAVGNGTVTLAGEAIGAKNMQLYKGVVRFAYMISTAVSVLTLVVAIMFPKIIIGLFTDDVYLIENIVVYLILVVINLFAKSSNIIIGDAIRGAGDTKWMLMTQCIGTVGIICVSHVLVYVLQAGLLGVFLAIIFDEYFRASINLLRYRFITRRASES